MDSNVKLFHGRRRNTPGPTVVFDDAVRCGIILRHRGAALDWNWGSDATTAEMERLAAAILAESAEGLQAPHFIADFARDVVAFFPEAGFTISDWQIHDWVELHYARR